METTLHQPTQPPKKTKPTIIAKASSIILLIFVCYIPTLFIQGLLNDRTYYQNIALENDRSPVSVQPVADITAHEQLLADYQAVDRVIKYAILFITLTFALFFLFEVLQQIKIHPINYSLVGLALAMFYLLLLSFTEIIGFTSAYLIAAGAVVLLISTYIKTTLGDWKKTGILTGLLISLYAYLLMLLQLEQYSLLFGSLLVFITLATIMLSTRKIDWYDV